MNMLKQRSTKVYKNPDNDRKLPYMIYRQYFTLLIWWNFLLRFLIKALKLNLVVESSL